MSPHCLQNPYVILLYLIGLCCCSATEDVSAGALACFTGHVSHVCVFSYVNVFMNLFVCVSVYARQRERKGGEKGRERVEEKDLQQLRLDLLTLLKMTYQITQRTGICPCP